MSNHTLDVPASPSLDSVQCLIQEADLVLAIGTEIGPTDYDMYETGDLFSHPNLVRVDIDQAQLKRGPKAQLSIQADLKTFLAQLNQSLHANHTQVDSEQSWGAERASKARYNAQQGLSESYRGHISMLHKLWSTFPEAIIIGDSTQTVYAGNLYCEAPSARAWFNSATGFGTLGYAAPAAIGTALAKPDHNVICLIGDGGLQFTLAELGSAKDAQAKVAFVVWNNNGYQEIENAMLEVDIEPIGVTPSAPDFTLVAQAYDLPARRVSSAHQLCEALTELTRPCLIEFDDRPNTKAEA